MNYAEFQRALIHDIGGFTYDPLGHALYAYPWGKESLTGIAGPRQWQREELAAIGAHLSNPLTRYTPYRSAVTSGHGIGKSALVGMITKWALDTCDDTRVVVTANTEAQILGKTWPEITKWHNLSITRDWFKPTATALISVEPGHNTAWRADAVTWSINNTEAFAGLHNFRKRIVVIMDESSGIADKVAEVTQGALTDEETEILWLAYGNPTKNTGWFREAFSKHRNLWRTKQIDSREVEGTNRTYLQEMVDTYGEDSDIVRIRVKGQFPRASSLQFISTEVAQEARTRVPAFIVSDPLVYGVDCARFGDDTSVLAKRRGRDARSLPWVKWQQQDTMRVAGDIALQAEIEHPDAIFVDEGGIGAGVVDRLRQLNVPRVFGVQFGGGGRDAIWSGETRVKTMNKRAEMWVNGRAWLNTGSIPDDNDLEADLTGVEYGYGADQTSILLEKKEHMKARGLASPDNADALMLTFAEPVRPRTPAGVHDARRPPAEHDPFAVLNQG